MTKQEFLDELRSRLSKLPSKDAEEHINFYSEMIDDRTEDGISEEDAVAEIGSIDEIAAQITADFSLTTDEKKADSPKRKLKTWEIVLLAAGAPIWVSLLAAAVVVVISGYASIWAVLAAFWASFGEIIVISLGCIASGVAIICIADISTGFIMISYGLVMGGLSIFLFFGCKASTKVIIKLTGKVFSTVKRKLKNKEAM